jgi:hypothetical protein
MVHHSSQLQLLLWVVRRGSWVRVRRQAAGGALPSCATCPRPPVLLLSQGPHAAPVGARCILYRKALVV